MGGRSGLNAVGRYLVWSDIPRNEQLRYNEEDDHIGRRFAFSHYSNGNTFDYQGGNILRALHPAGGALRMEWHQNGAGRQARWQGIQRSQRRGGASTRWRSGSPTGYGSLFAYEGNLINAGNPQPIRKEAIYRIDAQTGKIDMMSDELAGATAPPTIKSSMWLTRARPTIVTKGQYAASRPSML